MPTVGELRHPYPAKNQQSSDTQPSEAEAAGPWSSLRRQIRENYRAKEGRRRDLWSSSGHERESSSSFDCASPCTSRRGGETIMNPLSNVAGKKRFTPLLVYLVEAKTCCVEYSGTYSDNEKMEKVKYVLSALTNSGIKVVVAAVDLVVDYSQCVDYRLVKLVREIMKHRSLYHPKVTLV